MEKPGILTKTEPTVQRPKPLREGLIPTLNQRGFMSETLDYFSACFVTYAGELEAEVLDMGCAYGVATRAALEKGARVHACDMDPGHVEILAAEVPSEQRQRLRTTVGVLPHVDFPDTSYGAILCSRVLHFLLAAEIRTTLDKMYRWLQANGRLFLVADSPYTGFWKKAVAEYERRKSAGDEWPGLIEDIGALFDGGRPPEGMLPYLNPLDPETLQRECVRAGFVVEEAGFTGRETADRKGRHHAGLIAVKPGS
jgi:SAM-dependent methyltransferase